MFILTPGFEVLILVLALALAGLFSASETALMSMNRAKLKARLDAGDRAARRIHALIQQPRRLLSTILLGNALSLVTAVVVGTMLALQLVHDHRLRAVALAIPVLTLTFVALGEIIPKSVAASRAELIASVGAGPIRLAMIALRPLIAVLLALTTPIIRLMGGQEALLSPRYTEDELKLLLELGHEQGVIEEDESELVSSALAFDDTPVSSILTPRVDIVALPDDASLDATLASIRDEGYSRIPIYRGSIDQIVGILRARDALLAAATGERFDLPRMLMPVYFVPQNKRLNELLREMQAKEIQMAVVNDEYGGTAGLVTIEDILEQIVGEIRDELDEEIAPVRPISEGVALVDSMAAIDEVNQALGLELPLDGYQTIGGLVLNHLGRVAKVGDVVELPGVRITVKLTKGIRVQQVCVEHQLPLPTSESS